MKSIRFFHRRVSYKSPTASRKQCEKSLQHSLRIPFADESSVKQFEWNDKLINNNLIWCNGSIQKLENFEDDDKWELLFETAPKPELRNKAKLQKQQRQYRYKIKKAIDTEKKLGNSEIAAFMQQVLDTEGRFPYSKLVTLEKLEMSRRKQRIKMLETYLNAHNQLVNRVPSANSTYTQEGIFKIPHQWEVGPDAIQLEEYILFAHKFLTQHFPEYPIQLIIAHDDERSEEMDTGQHVHYFLSGQNKSTGRYDLHKKQIQVVNQYLKSNGRDDELLPTDGSMTRRQSKAYGSYFQQMVRDYVNQHLLNPVGLNAEFADETEKKSEQYRRMNLQAKLPKHEREFNFYNMQIEQSQEELSRLRAEARTLAAQNNHLVPILEKAETELLKVDGALQLQNSELNRLYDKQNLVTEDIETLGARYIAMEQSVEVKQAELSQVEIELEQAESRLAQVDIKYQSLIEKIVKNVFMIVFAKSKNQEQLSQKYTDKLISMANQHLPQRLQPVLAGAMDLSDDEELLKDIADRSETKEQFK